MLGCPLLCMHVSVQICTTIRPYYSLSSTSGHLVLIVLKSATSSETQLPCVTCIRHRRDGCNERKQCVRPLCGSSTMQCVNNCKHESLRKFADK
ncbi:hypothetical protein Q1695_000673 [Nippostrongylus brasiliensis]|nr:hypothetical protein Q1695_000673 [Nippostrongylus brasiliensis]